jgi:hypothetical protein
MVISLLYVSLCREMIDMGRRFKETKLVMLSSYGRYKIETRLSGGESGRMLKRPFNSSGGCESDGPRSMTDVGGVDLMLQFWLESECDGMKHRRKLKRRQRAHIDSVVRKYDMLR